MQKRTSTQRATVRRLRGNQTDVERTLWLCLRNKGLGAAKFRRQHLIRPYIVDFCCPEQKLVVEIDGDQHAAGTERDQQRTDILARKGFRVMRFRDHEVLGQLESVLEQIGRELQSPSTSP